jgi:hypothetical protein
VLYVGENFSGDAADDLLRPVKQWQAREESKDLAKVTIRGMLTRVEGGYWNGGSPPFGYDLRYESPREDGGAFHFVLRFQADGSKLVQGESGEVVRTLARGERLQVSKRDRSPCAAPPAFPAQRKEDRARPGPRPLLKVVAGASWAREERGFLSGERDRTASARDGYRPSCRDSHRRSASMYSVGRS